ncbi:TonB-dependent receptor [Aegicerativicinus sediminis]|uniref:TonB-dependent receptor n=1 Tax=Aegicerativicinus sediminis TaxID=2893202 RepID=UPI001E35F1F5|nr:TonB-dependent receptor [Aegicerativicinus sediminis]
MKPNDFYSRFLLFHISLFTQLLTAQMVVSGTVSSAGGSPVEGANVYLDGTYDGTSSDVNGKFEFSTGESGNQTLVISFISFETFKLIEEVEKMIDLRIELKEDIGALDAVVISAGTFEAGDNSKVSVLKPLDVVTTASALGDFVGALQTLPGTSTVAEDGRLFVRGGEAGESQIFIDGIRVFTPYTASPNNVPSRGRYSPFLFDGITFSTGGYSAEYGQALSSVLLLKTIDEPTQEKTDISVMSVGLGLGNTQIWDKNSLSVNASYFNLSPYNAIFPDRNDWEKPFEVMAAESVFRRKFNNGLLKIYGAFDATNFELTQEDINYEDGLHFKLKNNNFYSNFSYEGRIGDSWKLFSGGSFTRAFNDLIISDQLVENIDNSLHLKLKLKKRFNKHIKLNFGAEYFYSDFKETYAADNITDISYGYNNPLGALFAETDVIFIKKLAAKVGVRAEYGSFLEEFTLSPRISFAYKTSKNGQLSLAYGKFYQQPFQDVIKFSDKMESPRTDHYILNYQFSYNNRIFRAEVYRKNYHDLITYSDDLPNFDSDFGNDGKGYAQGIDFFWRDNQSLKNIDYWVSYSYLDTERLYLNYPYSATPPVVNKHNISVVGKYWIENWRSQVGFSYNYGSGRSYTNPNKPGILQEKTKPYNSLSFNWAYLLSQQKILYFSISNALGFKNVNGYQYADRPDNGIFDRRTLRPAADQFFFIGFFWTLSDDGRDNQLDNL